MQQQRARNMSTGTKQDMNEMVQDIVQKLINSMAEKIKTDLEEAYSGLKLARFGPVISDPVRQRCGYHSRHAVAANRRARQNHQ